MYQSNVHTEYLPEYCYSFIMISDIDNEQDHNVLYIIRFPGSLVVRIPRSHRGGRGSIPRLGRNFCIERYWLNASI